MAAIVEVGGSRRLQLGNEEFIRQLNFGPRWSKIRVGIMLGFQGTSTFAGRMLTGICQGTTNGFSAPLTDGGLWITGVSYATDPTWTYTNGSPPYYINGSGNKRAVTRIGSTVTDSNSGGSAAAFAAAAYGISQYFITFTRSPAWNTIINQQAVSTQASQLTIPITDFTFYRNMENEAGTTYVAMNNDDTAQTTTFTAATMPVLDSFSLYWNRSCPVLEIVHMGVVRFQ